MDSNKLDYPKYKEVLRLLNRKEWTEMKTKLVYPEYKEVLHLLKRKDWPEMKTKLSSDADETIVLLRLYINAYHATLNASEEFTKVEEIIEELEDADEDVDPELWNEYERLSEVYHTSLVKESETLAELNKIL